MFLNLDEEKPFEFMNKKTDASDLKKLAVKKFFETYVFLFHRWVKAGMYKNFERALTFLGNQEEKKALFQSERHRSILRQMRLNLVSMDR